MSIVDCGFGIRIGIELEVIHAIPGNDIRGHPLTTCECRQGKRFETRFLMLDTRKNANMGD
jgi:hypothetical protein